jgi:hypothetical protein
MTGTSLAVDQDAVVAAWSQLLQSNLPPVDTAQNVAHELKRKRAASATSPWKQTTPLLEARFNEPL